MLAMIHTWCLAVMCENWNIKVTPQQHIIFTSLFLQREKAVS